MKICSKRKNEKTLSDYFIKDKRTGRLHAQCKSCNKIQRTVTYKAHYLRNREMYLSRAISQRTKLRNEFRYNMSEFMADKFCIDCGENDMRVLELDHIDSSKKVYNISQAVKLGFSWQDVLLEIEKCRVLCANCHKKRTAQQFRWYKAL
jgi:hypothetical protein